MQKFYKIFLMMVLSLFLTSCDDTPKGHSNISVQDAYKVLTSGDTDFVFVDVRTPGEYQGGHVPGAVNIPVQVLAERLAEVPKDKTVYVYCKSGGRSTKAANILVDAGFANVVNMKASMDGWKAAGLTTER